MLPGPPLTRCAGAPLKGSHTLAGANTVRPYIPLPIVIAYLKLFVGMAALVVRRQALTPRAILRCCKIYALSLKSQEQSCAKSYSHPCENCPKAGDIAPVTNLSSPAEWCKTVNMPKFCYTHPGVRIARKSSQKSRKSLDSKPFTLYTETVSQKWNRAP